MGNAGKGVLLDMGEGSGLKQALSKLLTPPVRIRPSQRGGGLVPAGVIVPVVPKVSNGSCGASGAGDFEVMFTVRTFKVKDHKGQVAFPGGVYEEGDSDLLNTALRETREETGINLDEGDVIGMLSVCETLTGYLIHPYVALVFRCGVLKPSVDEIEKIFCVSMSYILNSLPPRKYRVMWDSDEVEVEGIEWEGCVIWGATLRIVQDFAERLRGLF